MEKLHERGTHQLNVDIFRRLWSFDIIRTKNSGKCIDIFYIRCRMSAQRPRLNDDKLITTMRRRSLN